MSSPNVNKINKNDLIVFKKYPGIYQKRKLANLKQWCFSPLFQIFTLAFHFFFFFFSVFFTIWKTDCKIIFWDHNQLHRHFLLNLPTEFQELWENLEALGNQIWTVEKMTNLGDTVFCKKSCMSVVSLPTE